MSSVKKQPRNNWIFFLMIFLSGLVAVYDTVLTIVFAQFLPEMEQNPVASAVINYGGVPLLVQIKAAGTILAAAIMCRLVYTKYRVTILPVFIIQLLLFGYLTFYTQDSLISDDAWRTVEKFVEFFVETNLRRAKLVSPGSDHSL